MNASLARAEALLNSNRPEPAAEELRKLLAEDPENGDALVLLARALSRLKKYKEAAAAAEGAVGLMPDSAYAYYVQGCVHHDADALVQARAALEEAIRINPANPHAHSLLANIDLRESRFHDALERAETALQLDPENILGNNVRAGALLKLGRVDLARDSLHATLSRNPEDVDTHSNLGWHVLQTGNHRAALDHFLEALRLDPDHENARSGMLYALKARSPFMRLILAYFFWLARLSPGARWGVVIGALIGYRVLANAFAGNESLTLAADAIIWTYLLFVVTSWAGDAFMNIFLLAHPLARHALKAWERTAAFGTAAVVALGLGSLILSLTTGNPESSSTLHSGAIAFLLAALPIGAMNTTRSPLFRIVSGLTALAVISLILLGIFFADASHLVSLALFLSVGFCWIASFVLSKER